MAVAKVGTNVAVQGGIVAGSGNPQTLTVPAGGYPVGTVVTIFGLAEQIVSITDVRGNTWNRRLGPPSGGPIMAYMYLWDCRVTTALLAGDAISLTRVSTAFYGVIMQGWSGCDARNFFDGVATQQMSSSTPSTPPLQTTSPGNAVFACFASNGGSAAGVAITTPGSGYTNETGATSGNVEGYGGTDWESKIAGAAALEQASCTWGSNVFVSGLIAAYGIAVANPSMVGVN
jgi:hypothetical protein